MPQQRKIIPPVYMLLALLAMIGLHSRRHAEAPFELLGTASAMVPIAVFVWIIQQRFIRGEERFLDEIFGEQYRGYKSRVRRWI